MSLTGTRVRAETAMAILRKGRMIWHFTLQTKPG
jgi:hypothetical protein